MNISHVRSILVLGGLLLGGCAHSEECELDAGRASFGDGDYELSLRRLAPCESDEAVSGETLGILATLYALVGDFTSDQERADRVHQLYLRAARSGNFESLMSLANMYAIGEDAMGIKPNRRVESCLLDLAKLVSDSELRLEHEVDACIALSE